MSGENVESGPRAEEKERPAHPAEFVFAEAKHTPENASKIASALQDCDILLLELVSGSSRERDRFSWFITNYLKSDATDAERQEIKQLAHEEFGSNWDELDQRLADALVEMGKTDKNVLYIDVGDQLDEEKAQRAAIQDRLNHELQIEAPNDVLRASWEELLTHQANMNRHRERVISRQLAIAAEFTAPSDRPLRIGVLLGATHTAPFHAIKRLRHPAQREFINPDTRFPLQPTEKMRYTNQETAIRHLTMRPDIPLDPRLLNRLLLTSMYQSEQFFGNSTRELIQAGLTDRMSDAEVTGLLDSIESAKQSFPKEEQLPGRKAAVQRLLTEAYEKHRLK